MGAGNFLDFDIGIAVLSTYDGDKFPGIQIDAYGEKKSGVPPYEQHSPSGFLSRPHDPDTDSNGNPTIGCTVLYALEGGRGHAWVSHDPRVVPILPLLTRGGSVMYGGKLKTPSFIYTNGDTGSQTHYVPYAIVNDVATKAMAININVDVNGDEYISIIHGEGMAITMMAGSKNSIVIKNKSGNAYVEVNDEGVVINGTLTVQGGFNAGGPATATPVALAAPLIAILQQIVKLLGTASTGPAPLTAGAAAIASQLATIAAKNTHGA